MSKFSKYSILIIFLFLVTFHLKVKCQNVNYDCNKDTVLIIGEKKLCEFKNYLNREDILNSELIVINHDDLQVLSYNVSSFTLGNELDLVVTSEIIPLELKQAIVSTEVQYKYINFKNILIVDKQNNTTKPTLQNIKIIFLD